MSLKDTQVNELLKIIKVEPRSVKDVSDIVGVHYATAHKWVKELERRGLIVEMAFQRGKEKVYCPATEAATEDGIVNVQFRGGMVPIARLAYNDPEQLDPFRYSQCVLAAAYQKSLKAAGISNYQVGYTPLELLDQVRKARALLLDELAYLEQVLLVDEVWEMDKDSYKVMGPLPYPVEEIMTHVQPVEDRYRKERTSGG